MVFGIIDNFANQFQDTTEAFENQDDDYSNDNNIIDLDILKENSIITENENENENNNKQDEVIEEEDYSIQEEKENEIVGEEEQFNNLIEGFNNYDVVENFTGGDENEYKNYKLVLKSILFGLLFFILSNAKIYAITKPLTKGLDRQVIHAIIFTLLYYIVNTVIN